MHYLPLKELRSSSSILKGWRRRRSSLSPPLSPLVQLSPPPAPSRGPVSPGRRTPGLWGQNRNREHSRVSRGAQRAEGCNWGLGLYTYSWLRP